MKCRILTEPHEADSFIFPRAEPVKFFSLFFARWLLSRGLYWFQLTRESTVRLGNRIALRPFLSIRRNQEAGTSHGTDRTETTETIARLLCCGIRSKRNVRVESKLLSLRNTRPDFPNVGRFNELER
jgi:hypothetical protein